MSWSDFNLTFDLATGTHKILSQLHLGNQKVYEDYTRYSH